MCQDKETLKLERENVQTNLVLNKYNHVCQHSKKCDICFATVDPSKIRKSNLLLDVHLMFVNYTFSSVWVAEWPPFGK